MKFESAMASIEGAIHLVARRLVVTHIQEKADALQEMRLSAWKAFQSYNPEKGASYLTYAIRVMNQDASNIIITHFRKKNTANRQINDFHEIDSEYSVVYEPSLLFEKNPENGIVADLRFWLLQRYQETKMSRYITTNRVVSYLLQYYTVKEIAEKIGTSKAYIYSLVDNIIQKEYNKHRNKISQYQGEEYERTEAPKGRTQGQDRVSGKELRQQGKDETRCDSGSEKEMAGYRGQLRKVHRLHKGGSERVREHSESPRRREDRKDSGVPQERGKRKASVKGQGKEATGAQGKKAAARHG